MTIREMLETVLGYETHFDSVDAVVVRQSQCDSGHTYNYRGFKKGDRYRAFCVCEECDIAEEF